MQFIHILPPTLFSTQNNRPQPNVLCITVVIQSFVFVCLSQNLYLEKMYILLPFIQVRILLVTLHKNYDLVFLHTQNLSSARMLVPLLRCLYKCRLYNRKYCQQCAVYTSFSFSDAFYASCQHLTAYRSFNKYVNRSIQDAALARVLDMQVKK